MKSMIKNLGEIDLSIWNFEIFKSFTEDYLKGFYDNGKTPPRDNNEIIFPGFSLFRPELVHLLNLYERSQDYSPEKSYTPLEMQSVLGLPLKDYHKFVVASYDQEVVGAVCCQWSNRIEDFWSFYMRSIEVRKDMRHQGIASCILNHLDGANFLQGKILQVGSFTKDGDKYLSHVVKNKLKAENYALILGESIDSVPTKPGIYEGRCNL